MKVYEAIYNNKETQGVYGISLVENPAMEDEWIALSEQKAELHFAAVDEKKRLLLGAVLIPEKKIYRNIDGNEFYITFTSDTIGQLAHDFITKGNQNNSSAEHETQLSDVSFVESWQVEDPSIDKSALYGKMYEKGTWVTMAKVSPELYEQATNGTFKGFSIDALLGLQELKFNTNINMTKQDFLNELKSIFSFSNESEKVEDVKAEEIEVKSEEVAEVTEATEEPQIDMMEAIKEIMAEFKSDVDTKIETLKTELSKEEVVDEVKEEVKAKDDKIVELETELAKQPEVAPIKAKPESKVVQTESKQYKGIKSRVFANLIEQGLI